MTLGSAILFAALHSGVADVTLPAATVVRDTLADERTRWHMVIPAGQVDASSGATWDAERLAAYAAGTRALFAAQAKAGAPSKGLPVSYMHAIEARMMSGAATGSGDLKRAGTVYGVAVSDGETQPAGLYLLIEWTPEAWASIESGTWHDLSVAVHPEYPLADGSTIAGCVFGCALVDVGYFEAIPSARDGLPRDAFDATGAPVGDALYSYRRATAARLYSRMHSMEAEMKADAPAAGGDMMAKLMEIEKIASEGRDLARQLIAKVEELHKMEADEVLRETAELEVKAKGADDECGDMAERIYAKTLADAEGRILADVKAKVGAGHLVPSQIKAYAKARHEGRHADADGLLYDYTGAAAKAGSMVAAPVAPVAAKTMKTAEGILADIKAKHGGKVTPAAFEEYKKTVAAAQADGSLAS